MAAIPSRPRICAPGRAIGTSTLTHVTIATPQQFAQQNPRYTCKRAGHFHRLSQSKGYKCKCRDPRCSLECNKAWSRKVSSCLSRHLLSLQDQGWRVFRGNLMMPKGSTPDDHGKAKASFLLSIKRWAKRHDHTVELHGVLHVTGPQEAHWDIVVWTDAPYHPLHEHVGQAWPGRWSLIAAHNLEATANYTAKPVARVREQAHYLPAPSAVCGLNCHFATRGFWCGKGMEGIWREVVAEWLGTTPALTSKTDITDTPPAPESIPEPYIPGADRVADRARFAAHLPTTPEESIGLADYAQRWGVSPGYMRDVLASVPMVRVTNGELVNGNYDHQGYWRSPAPPQRD